MTIYKTPSGRWRADVKPNGRAGKRYRKTFQTKAEAQRWISWLRAKTQENPDWQPQKKTRTPLLRLIERWFVLHGQHLKDGAARKRQLEQIAKALGNPSAETLTATDFAVYRQNRLQDGVSPNTVNHDHAYLRALFYELERLGEWDRPNPIKKVKRLKVDEQELAFLTAEQIRALLDELRQGRNKNAYHVARVCLATGARWSEAETLRGEQVTLQGITFTGTKSGKNRTIPIDPELHDSIKGRENGRLFTSCYGAFRNAIERAGIVLPKGQLSHVLRHTFASHFMMAGGNILVLQRILGHASLTMTMRYAHFAPDHLEHARTLNPLKQCGI